MRRIKELFERLGEPGKYVLMLASIPIAWTILVRLTRVPSFLIPPPEMVAKVLWVESGTFWFHTEVTMAEAMTGYLVANVLAVGLAITFLYLPWTEQFATPYMVMLKNIPFVTVAALLIITLGTTPAPKVIIVVLVCFFPILANVVRGLRSVDAVLLDRMKTLNASQWQIFTKVRWPAALPYYVAAHEISFTGSIIGAVVAEWMFARQGLGYLITASLLQYRADRLYAVTVINLLLSLGAYFLVRLLDNRLFRWKRDMPT
jgi:NitT/TauT family transport system permease protein